ncbi:TetR/AcrR family transcriptional regulator [Phytoactinopolyspora alkaliphila]|uniref:TetR/AcrR family transcriptional regulator n=1 Tax=Phytoactinopolyspora alkaliphila TaxID=1783498 RepID=A0A6N9YLB8_9ACTN|nr:TetR/AcrR family transcriptional regulator [Phytoactinopolyspora alkaliphila]NED95742.1 TetR/AcrR family transcriptional regulator [Phytoactinopolyspora alkaliphila]
MTTEYSGSGDLHRSLELLWRRGERPTRGPKPGLTLDKIIIAAIEVADAEGLEALSMRKVAAKLGVGTMSLYRYVPGKSELLDLMLDHVVKIPGELSAEGSQHWRAFLEADARGHWQLCLDHQWYPFVDQTRPLLGPNGLRGVEYAVGQLSATGLSDQELIMLISVVSNFVEATARTYISELQAEKRTGVSNDEFWAAQEPVLVEAMNSGEFPTMAQLSEDTFWFTHEQVFEFGLQRLLDGFEAFIESR